MLALLRRKVEGTAPRSASVAAISGHAVTLAVRRRLSEELHELRASLDRPSDAVRACAAARAKVESLRRDLEAAEATLREREAEAMQLSSVTHRAIALLERELRDSAAELWGSRLDKFTAYLRERFDQTRMIVVNDRGPHGVAQARAIRATCEALLAAIVAAAELPLEPLDPAELETRINLIRDSIPDHHPREDNA